MRITRGSWIFVLSWLLAVSSSARAQVGGDHTDYLPADIAFGATLYAKQCAQCHGATGDLVGTVDLRRGRFKNATTDQQIMNLIRSGIPAAGMPGFKFTNAELVGVVAYLRNMNTFDAKSVSVGNANRGKAVFDGKGTCRTCHQVNGRGAGLAPDLFEIGTTRTAASIEEAIVDPTAAMLPINRPVRAVTKDGRTINGRRLNEDTFTVQVMDERGALLSLVKADLREYTVLRQSPMPSYKGKLSAEEVADLVAYLLTLRGD